MNQVDNIIQKLQEMLREGVLESGKKIPSERVLAERFRTTRGYVRKALQKLEFYGVLKIVPQKGIYVSSIRPNALDVLMTNVLTVDIHDMPSLIETRSNLEIFSANLAAERGDAKDFQRIEEAHNEFIKAYENDKPTLEEDHLFHLAIVKASKNTVLQTLITLITPEIIAMNKDFKENMKEMHKKSLYEHKAILKSLLARDPAASAEAMSQHMMQSRSRRLDKKLTEE
ncbi:MAG: FadR family transcriptional regulator [Bacteroidetes bacterium]|nr:FadR family transcriptional regulator [Bacteroidota bacterium]